MECRHPLFGRTGVTARPDPTAHCVFHMQCARCVGLTEWSVRLRRMGAVLARANACTLLRMGRVFHQLARLDNKAPAIALRLDEISLDTPARQQTTAHIVLAGELKLRRHEQAGRGGRSEMERAALRGIYWHCASRWSAVRLGFRKVVYDLAGGDAVRTWEKIPVLKNS